MIHYASWVKRVSRFGFAARGVLYLAIGYIALRAAVAAGSPAGAAGALRELLQNGGRWLVLVVAAGLAAHALWCLLQCIRNPEHRGNAVLQRAAYLLSAVIHASLAVSAVQLWMGQRGSTGSDGDDGQTVLAAELLELPFGETLVALVGLGVIGYALQQLWLASRGDVAKRLRIDDASRHRAVVLIGRVGIGARSIVLGILGVFFIQAARHHDPDAAGGTQDALRSFDNPWILGAVAVGLFAFGLFQVANAVYRKIPVR